MTLKTFGRTRLAQQDDWFDRYHFCQPIGRGGMGVVYLAEDNVRAKSPCVIKQLSSQSLNADERQEAIRLFTRETQILRSLDHPGIVRVFDDHATSDGQYFLVMDYVPGKNLENILATYGPFDSESTIEIAIQCCEVLEYLHKQQPPVLYRDLKPSNLMLTPDGKVVFIDFGVARLAMPKDASTRVITAGYSPPEQYLGRPETRSDLYALGATLSHLLTGQRPKPISTSYPKAVERSVLASLDKLVQALTAYKVEDRPLTALNVRHTLYDIYKEIHPEFDPNENAVLLPAKSQNVSMDTNNQFKSQQNSQLEKRKLKRTNALTKALQRNSSRGEVSDNANTTSKKNGIKTLWRRLEYWLKIKFP